MGSWRRRDSFARRRLPALDEFRVPGNPVWNAFLAVFLVALVVVAVMLQRYFWKHPSEIGEARFDTTNSGEDR